MAGNQAVVEFLLKWSESGGQLPEKVKRDLDRMGQSSNQATTLTDKLGQAFTRLERREPTLAVRQLKGAVDSLAGSALGASGPVGRLGLTFLSLGPGGIATTAAIAGLGLIGLAYKQSAKEANEYLDITEKAIDATRRLLGSRHLAAIEERATVRDQLRIARERLAFEQHPVIEGFAATPSPAKIQEASAAVRALELQFAIADAAVRHIEESMRDSLAKKGVEHVKEFGAAWNTVLNQLESFGGKISDVRVQINTQNLSLAEQARLVRDLDLAYTQLGARLNIQPGRAAPQLPLGTTRPFPTLRGGKPEFIKHTENYNNEPELPSGDQTAEILSAVLGLIGSARGGAGGALSGLGGLASVAFRSTPILGQVLSFGGGLLSLFSSGQARFKLSDIEGEALEKMRQVQQIPQYLSQNIVTNDLRGAKNRLARLEQLDTVTRGVT